MTVEAQLRWSDNRISGLDRLWVPVSALTGDGRWQAARQHLETPDGTQLDASPWITPRDQPIEQVPFDSIRLRSQTLPERFYPRMTFPKLARGPRDLTPQRLLEQRGDVVLINTNHPLADLSVSLHLQASTLDCAPATRLAELFNGPGMQRPVHDPFATYLSLGALQRENEEMDDAFYSQPRFVHHLDATCRAQIGALYARLLPDRGNVLDLMASWDSHLPQHPSWHLAGLGLNGAELHANLRLNERVVKDLNSRPELPWSDAEFDAVICTAAIEYLIHPLETLLEVKRVLKPGGLFVVTFSDRWFPPKAIKVWRELHPFERMGLVASLFAAAGFAHLHCESGRGLKRPDDDKYSSQRVFSDPLFAVWGRVPTA